jgi:uncharacterized protein (TIGR02145 family)
MVAAICAVCGLVFAQTEGKPKIAMYIVSDRLPMNQQEVLATKFLVPFTSSGLYEIADRSKVFLNKKMQEMRKQMGGDVDDRQIAELGVEAGAKYVCIITLTQGFGYEYNISARMVDVATALIYRSVGQTDVDNLTGAIVDKAAQKIYKQIHSGDAPTPAATSSAGTGNTFTDSRDGKTYRTVKIEGRTWMAENLNYRIGTSWCYDGDGTNCNKYGRLYDWHTARSACPVGWHLSTRQEWDELVEIAGGKSAGLRLKSRSPGWNGGDDHGFSALPGGYRYIGGPFSNIGSYGDWWTATEKKATSAYYRFMRTGSKSVEENNDGKDHGLSVRCIKD